MKRGKIKFSKVVGEAKKKRIKVCGKIGEELT